tara:strand:+ start:1054 stop:1602 length:549 start_codon:yes stop_codon:yes gene_type:complete
MELSGCSVHQSNVNKNISIGQTHQGGIILHLFQDGDIGYVEGEIHGLIAAPSDQSKSTIWGWNDTEISTADGIIIGTGAQNTLDIIAGCSEAEIAAALFDRLELAGYDDWFLPSKNELNLMYRNIGKGDSLGLGNIGGFVNGNYWSSTQYNDYDAWAQNFGYGYQTPINKYGTKYVRAVRAF